VWAPEIEMRECGRSLFFHPACADRYWAELYQRRKAV
jgi:hypothetical protein